MPRSLSSAVSGMQQFQQEMDVIGNNIANVNTIAFKSSRVELADSLSQTLAQAGQIGLGVTTAKIDEDFAQGAVSRTSVPTDLSVSGDGFFVVNNTQGNQLYTRAGSFQVDSSGTLRTNTGEAVQGWTTINSTTGLVDTNTAIANIEVPVGGVKKPVATTDMTLDLNLNSGAKADATSDHSETIKVFDSLGTSHTLTVNFEKTDANTWSYAVTIPGEDISGGTAGTPSAISGASGTLTFGSDGQLSSPANGTTIPVAITGLSDGASDMSVTWNPYTTAGAGRITQFGQPSAPEASSQDGSAASQLTRVGLANGGELLAQYSDGTQVVVGQVAMANIRNPESLIAVGNNNYEASALTASPAIGVPNTGGRGDIQGGSIESSTVDIAQEFTNLIVLQRGYQANSRVITTADTLSQETINLIH